MLGFEDYTSKPKIKGHLISINTGIEDEKHPPFPLKSQTYCRNNHGAYPVYSATNNAPLGNINTYDYNGRFLTISINGLAGKITIFDEKFSTNADRVVMLPKEGISIDYIRHVAEPILRNSVKGRKGDLGKNEFTKLTPTMILNTYVPIPLNDDSSFNYERQCELASIYNNIEQQKNPIR